MCFCHLHLRFLIDRYLLWDSHHNSSTQNLYCPLSCGKSKDVLLLPCCYCFLLPSSFVLGFLTPIHLSHKDLHVELNWKPENQLSVNSQPSIFIAMTCFPISIYCDIRGTFWPSVPLNHFFSVSSSCSGLYTIV